MRWTAISGGKVFAAALLASCWLAAGRSADARPPYFNAPFPGRSRRCIDTDDGADQDECCDDGGPESLTTQRAKNLHMYFICAADIEDEDNQLSAR